MSDRKIQNIAAIKNNPPTNIPMVLSSDLKDISIALKNKVPINIW
jgi:hypothetical protein